VACFLGRLFLFLIFAFSLSANSATTGCASSKLENIRSADACHPISDFFVFCFPEEVQPEDEEFHSASGGLISSLFAALQIGIVYHLSKDLQSTLQYGKILWGRFLLSFYCLFRI
jgi:hypothetical protein